MADDDQALGRVFNIGTSQVTTVQQLAERVIERTGSSSRIRYIPYELAYGDGFEELGSRKPNTAAIEKLSGWRPTRTIDDAIDDLAGTLRAKAIQESEPMTSPVLSGGFEEAAELFSTFPAPSRSWTATPPSPGSPASWMPLPFRSFQTKSPIAASL